MKQAATTDFNIPRCSRYLDKKLCDVPIQISEATHPLQRRNWELRAKVNSERECSRSNSLSLSPPCSLRRFRSLQFVCSTCPSVHVVPSLAALSLFANTSKFSDIQQIVGTYMWYIEICGSHQNNKRQVIIYKAKHLCKNEQHLRSEAHLTKAVIFIHLEFGKLRLDSKIQGLVHAKGTKTNSRNLLVCLRWVNLYKAKQNPV